MKLRRPPLLKRAVYDGYDYGLSLSFIEGGNRLLLDRQGYFIRRTEHPQHKAWRIPKGRLHEDPEGLFRELMALAPGRFNETLAGFLAKLDEARSHCERDAFTWGMRLRLAPLVGGGVLGSGDYHPGVVAVYKRMHGRYLSQMRAWQLSGTAEVVKLNLMEELGLSDDQFEILSTLQALHSDGSLAPARTGDGIRIGGDFPDAVAKQADDEDCKDIFLASIAGIERTTWTDAAISQALQAYSHYSPAFERVGETE